MITLLVSRSKNIIQNYSKRPKFKDNTYVCLIQQYKHKKVYLILNTALITQISDNLQGTPTYLITPRVQTY